MVHFSFCYHLFFTRLCRIILYFNEKTKIYLHDSKKSIIFAPTWRDVPTRTLPRSTFRNIISTHIMKNNLLRFFAISLFIVCGLNSWGATYTKETSSIAAGDVVLLVYETGQYELNGISTTSTKYGLGASYSTTPTGAYELTVEAGSTTGTFAFKHGSDYLTWTSGNSLNKSTTKSANTSWTVSFSSGNAVITNAYDDSRTIRWNNNSGQYRFACYTSGQQAVQLYKKASTCTNTPSMSFSEPTTVNKTTADNTFTKTVSISGKGSGQTVSYSSSDETIATVNNSGVVTLKGKVGSTTITASVEADGSYCSASASYTLNVTLAPINVTLYYKGTSATLNNQPNPYTLPTTGTYAADACDAWVFDGWYGSSYAKNTSKPTYITQLTSSGSAYAVYKYSEGGGSETFTPSTTTNAGWGNSRGSHSGTIGNFTIATDDGLCSTEIRTYSGSDFTVSATTGKISSITFTPSSGYYISNLSTDKGTLSGNVWTGDETSVTFSASAQVRFNAIVVGNGTTYYSTDAECGPKVQATASPWVTSTNGQFVKVEVPVTATNFDKSSTLSASVSGAGFSIVGWGANGNSVTKDVDLTTTLILAYNPSAYNTTADATITFSSNYSGSQTPIYTNGTVHGRSLPEKFVIAIKNDDQWYALPANMSGSGTYAGIAVDVDNTTTPTKVTAGPATALYSLLNVYKTSGAGDRYANYGTRVRFLGNEKCLWSNQANGGTGINNGAVPTSANSDNYEWTLVTTDGVIYAINTNVQQKITEGRELRYRAGESRFGMYTDGNSSFRFLPVDCDNRASVSAVATTYNSVTLTWTGKSGTDYNVYIDEGGVTKKTETSVTSPVTISGLSSATNYTWIISPGAKNDDCALSGDFTTGTAPINVTLSCDGVTHALGLQDKPYTLPTTGEYVANACAEWQFVGWTNGTYNKSTSAPTLITEMNEDGTAYAVYRKTDGAGGSEKYVHVTETEQITDGQYLIMCNSYGVDDDDPSDDYDYFVAFKGSLSALDANNNSISNIKRNFEEDTIGVTSTTTANEFTINITETTIRSASGYYIGNTGTGNGMNTSTSTKYTNTMAINGNGEFICEGSGGSVYLQYNNSASRFRYYSSSQTAIQLYKRTSGNTYYYSTSSECCNEVEVPTVTIDAVDVSAIISWNNQPGATNGYHVTCNGTDQDVAAGVTSLEITGLSPLTEYEYTVIAKGPTCNRSYNGTFTTANCSVIPTGVSITPGTGYAVVRWTHTSPTATVTVYSDEEATAVVKSEDNLSSGSTITGLEEGTTYFLRVFAGTDCGSAIVEFTTLSSAVIIAEWFPDGININLTADTATATVLIEDKQTTTATATSYADGLFFSKYYEAYLSVKLWAIYNGTNEKISLANIKVKSANNGNYWGKDNATGSGDTENAGKITSLATFGHHETGYIYPGEEIIVYNPGQATGTQDHNIIECMETAYGTAYKDDPDSLWYMVQNQTTALSGDDGLILLDGTDTLDVIGGKDAHEAWLNKAQPSWGDAAGWTCNNGEDVDGNTIGLSTNRCLLVRKNSVKSGLNAVANNTDNFYTLCDEWWGAHVPTSGDQVQTSCDNFSYVGHYDYNDYYAQFDSLTTVEELGGKQNEDGTFTIPIPQLDTLSCSMLRVNVYEGTELKVSAEYKVPIMVENSKATTADIFANEKHDAEACKTCDVVILKGATLTKADEGSAGDVNEVRNLTIYPGGTLIVPGPTTYNVASLQFRVEGENVPFLKLAGTLNSADQHVIVSRRINNDDAYFFSLPYDCNLADVRWSTGEPAILDEGFRLKEYDSQARADEGSTKGAPGHWKMITGSTIEAGKGYQISVNSKYLKELIFPMSISSANVSAAENGKRPAGDNVVPIHRYLSTTGKTKNNENWNFIAEPYLCSMIPMLGDKITAGWLKYTAPSDPNEEGEWTYEDGTHEYISFYNPATQTYDQKLYSAVDRLDPFIAFFVQAKAEGTFEFTESNRIVNSAPQRHLAAPAENEDLSIFAGVVLSGNGQSDETALRIRPDFSEEYELGYDLEKFITFYTDRPQIYMKTPDNRLAFQAVSDSLAKSTNLPMGVYCENAGTYTFTIHPSYPLDEIEAVYLIDTKTGITTNLLYDSYSFTATGRVYTEKRFYLNVIVNRKAPQVTTGTEQVCTSLEGVRKILINGNVYIQRGDAIYDITGKQMLNLK